MKLETEIRDDHQVRLLAEIEPERLEKTRHQAARKIAAETRIPGFRPGKAPFEMVKRFVGEEKIQREAIELLVDAAYPEAIKESGIDPYGPGSLEEIVSTDPVKFAFLVPLAPSVTLGDYRSVREDYNPPEVTEEKVDEFIEQLRRSYSTAEPVERPAQEGDVVFATVTARDTHPEEGKDPVIMDARPVQSLVKTAEEPAEDEWPFPGFSRTLLGSATGEEKTVTHTFSEGSPYEAMRGREIEYQFKVDSVKEMKLPELNDEFAQSTGEFADVAALRQAVRSGIESNTREEYDQEFYTRVLDQIKSESKIKYPPQMLQEEIDSTLKNVERDLAQQKMDLDTYLKVRQMDREKFLEEEVKPPAVRRLERSLLMDEIGRAEKIQLSNDELQAGLTQALSELQETGDFNKLRKQVGNQRLANAVALETASRLINRRVLDRIKEIASGQAEKAASEGIAESAAPETQPAGGEPAEKDTQPGEKTGEEE